MKEILNFLWHVFLIYITVVSLIFAIKHPDYTDTQRLINFMPIFTLQWEEATK